MVFQHKINDEDVNHKNQMIQRLKLESYEHDHEYHNLYRILLNLKHVSRVFLIVLDS